MGQVSTYSFKDHEKTTNIRVLDIKTGTSTTPIDEAGAGSAVWLNDDEILYVRSGEKGNSTLVVRNVTASAQSS